MSEVSFTSDRTSTAAAESSGITASSTWAERIASAWDAAELRLVRVSDWFNPILVKETRQALRSWQFLLTFVMLLVACWVITLFGMAVIGPRIYYAAGGSDMLTWYYYILSFPLIVIVPFSAFRSLAAEREDNTYDLLSITTLRPRQIVSGKIGSAVVQMVVFFSAIAPCLAFTYLLRGVDAPTIALLLTYTFFESLGLSMIGILLATISRYRYVQLVLTVLFIALLLGALFITIMSASELVRNGSAIFTGSGFWIGHLVWISLYGTTFALAYFAAAGMISFATENRSTPLRIVMLIQQAVFVGWMAYPWLEFDVDVELLVAMGVVTGSHWFVMGTMLNGERPEMSHRVMRRLPQSYFGRVFFTWFSPGPSTGYMFAVANLSSIFLISAAAAMFSDWSGAPSPVGIEYFYFLILGWCYVVAYLGLGCLVVALLRRVSDVTMFASVLLHVLLLLAGSGIPTSIQLMSLEMQYDAYSYLQVTNPFWTLPYVLRYAPTPEDGVLLSVVPAAAFCVLIMNLPGIVRELLRVRAALPTRVAQDEAELHPPPEAQPKNPWDAAE